MTVIQPTHAGRAVYTAGPLALIRPIASVVADGGTFCSTCRRNGVKSNFWPLREWENKQMGKRCLRTLIAGATGVAILGLSSQAAWAAPIAFDSFEEYSAGQLESNDGIGADGGFNFTGPYDVANGLRASVNVVSLSLTYTNGDITIYGGTKALAVTNTANSNELFSRPITAQSDTVYFSFLYRTTNPTTSEDFIQFGFSDAATGEPKVSIGTANNISGNAAPSRFFARAGQGVANGVQTEATMALQPDETYLLVGKFYKEGSSNYNRVDLWVNPSSLTESTPTLSAAFSSGTSTATLSNLILRTARLDSGDTYYFDHLTIGTTYGDVVPEPGTLALASGAIAAALLRRRREP